jgi:flagellar basal-body rod protein FlgB
MDDGFRILERLVYATQVRHKLLSSNIANTDTPNYRAKDLDFKSVIEGASASLRTTDPRHMHGAPGGAGSGGPASTESQSWGDDNNVELDMEVAKMTENGLLYETAVKLMSTRMRMIKNALGRR